MKLIFESQIETPSISNTLSMLTSGAEIALDDIHYDETKRIIEIELKRKEITGFKKSFLGIVQPINSQATAISLITIKEVIKMKMDVDNRLITECNSRFTVLLGMNIKGNEIYLGSAEESQGEQLCQIFISIDKLNIEFIDK